MPSDKTPSGTTVNLTNSTTKVPKATYVPLKVSRNTNTRTPETGGAIRKRSYIRSLRLQPGDVAAVQKAAPQVASSLYALVKPFEGTTLQAALPDASHFAAVSDQDLLALGNALAQIRQQAITAAGQAPTQVAESAVQNDPQRLVNDIDLANSAFVATKGLADSTTSATSPIGMLNLERIEMTPAGIERGGLIATIPLAPLERTTVVQQEWSVITQEFTSIVTDSLDNYSETGVTDNTQLAQSTTSQVAHANQFNINTSASGSCGFVTTSVAQGFAAQDQTSQSATDSRQHSVQTTKKASSRSIQSHKTTISTSTTTGSSDTTTRTLENPSATDPIRIDYFSIMRKWHCALYRYGLRLTYDITIPEPGAAMREVYAELDTLQTALSTQFTFNIKHSDISPDIRSGDSEPYYLILADKYSVDVPTPPSPSTVIVQIPPLTPSTSDKIQPVSFTVPSNYWIDSITLTGHIGEDDFGTDPFYVIGSPVGVLTPNGSAGTNLCAGNSFLWHQSGTQSITAGFQSSDNEDDGQLFLTAHCVPTDNAMAQWRSAVWTALYNAAQAQFYFKQQQLNAQISALQSRINGVDTLTLRREENDEIMKCALRWLLGHGFEFMPQNVVNVFKQVGKWGEKYGVDFTGNDSGLSKADWTIVRQNEDRINFINQAIDWDNVIYFVYSYFWDDPQSWDFIRQIQHPDATRQAFLRAGSARVVLTVRKGWELAWTYFTEFGSTSMPNPLPSHPYLTIAQQIEDYDAINYPGIPPADPDGGGPVDDGTPQVGTTFDTVITPSTSAVTITVADSTGFIAGTTAIINTWESTVQEKQTIVAVPDATHITVGALSNTHDPINNQNKPIPIMQAGESGLLIAEWFEYTPTSGIDIAVTSNLATIA
jgi:hypothetical protein